MNSETLFNIEHQTLEVFSLGMIDIDGMIGRLMQLMKDPNLSPSLCSSCENRVTEVFLRHHLRTTEGKEYATRLYLLQGLHVQSGITFEGMRESPTVLCESRRIENNKIVLVASLFEVPEGILAERLMTSVTGEIEFYITVREFDGFRTTVNRVYQFCPSPHGIERESTGITEHIKNPLAFSELFQ